MRWPALLLLPLATAALAQDEGVEIAPQRDGAAALYRVDGFDGIALGTAATVEVRVGPSWSVRATGPAAALAGLKVERREGTLRLRRRDERRRADNALDRQVRVFITMPRITDAAIGGSGQMIVDRVPGPRMHAAVGGSGSLMLGNVAVTDLDVAIGGSGNVTATGRAERLRVTSGGSGGFRGKGLYAKRADVTTAGSGGVSARVDGPANVSLVGSGLVDLGDGARCSVSRMGSGTVRCSG